MSVTLRRTPDEKAAGCTSIEEIDAFIACATARGDDETRQAGVRRRAELLKPTKGRAHA